MTISPCPAVASSSGQSPTLRQAELVPRLFGHPSLPRPKEKNCQPTLDASSGHPTACSPPVENSNPVGASTGADGQGVCTQVDRKPSTCNLDNTRMRMVRKGCTVRFPGGATATVARVRMGEFWTTTGYSKAWPTQFVWVV